MSFLVYKLKIKEIIYCSYIQNCHTCGYAKAPKNWYNGLLNPLSIFTCPWLILY